MKSAFLTLIGFLFASLSGLAQAPANDNFAAAIALAGGSGNQTGNNTSATLQAGEATTVQGYSSSRSVWYSWVATAAGSTTFSLNSAFTTFDSQLSVYTGAALGSLSLLGSQDVGGNGGDAVTFTATAGTTYRIRVAGYNGEVGAFRLDWVGAAPPTPRISVAGVQVDEDAGTATVTVTRSLVTTGAVSVDYETVEEIAEDGLDFVGTSGTLTFASGETEQTFEIDITDDALLEGWEYFFVMLSNPTAGATLLEDVGYVTIQDNEHPVNDNFSAALNLMGATGTTAGTNLNATTESDETEASVWYRWTAPASAVGISYTFIATSDVIAPGLRIFTGTTLDTLLEVNTVLNGAGVQFTAAGETTYYIRVTDPDGFGGSFDLSWQPFPGRFRVANATVLETAGTVQVTVLRELGSEGAVSVDYSLSEITAGALDYVDPGQVTLNFASGETSKSFDVVITDDATLEGRESFEVVLSDATGGALVATQTGVVTILDNERPTNDTFASAVVLSGQTGTIAGNNLNGSAEAGEFYGEASVWYKWTAPNAGYYRFELLGDTLLGVLDVFTGNAVNGLQFVATGQAPEFQAAANAEFYLRVRSASAFDEGTFDLSWAELVGSFSVRSVSVSEAAGQVAVTVVRERGDKGTVAISYATYAISASAGTDFGNASGTLNFADGELSKTVNVTIVQDSVVEGTEYFEVGLDGVDVDFDQSIAEVLILDDDRPGNDNLAAAIVISGASGTVRGNNTNASVEAGEPSGQSTVWYRWTAPSTGVYEFSPAVDVFTGATFGSLSVVTLSSPLVQAVAGTEYRIRMGGNEDEFDLVWKLATGTFRAIAPHTVNEGAGAVTVTMVRENGSAGVVSIDYEIEGLGATAGDDYSDVSGTLVFATGETSKTFTVTIFQDAEIEGFEDFDITFFHPEINVSSVSLFINDDDHPANDSFAGAQVLAGSSGTLLVDLLNTTREAGETVGGNLSSAWYRWTAPGDGAVAISNDSYMSMAAFTGAAVNGLTLVGLDETGLGLHFAVTAGTVYHIAIFDNGIGSANISYNFSATGSFSIEGSFDSANSDGVYASLRETGGQFVFTVRRTGGTGAVSLPYVFEDDGATGGDDYTGVNGTLEFAAGELLKTITIPVTNDAELEGNEGFSLHLEEPTPSALLGPVDYVYLTIDDDEDEPANDNFANATVLDSSILSGGDVMGRIQGATTEAGEPTHFDSGSQDGRTLWYRYTAAATGTLVLEGYSFQDADPDHTHALHAAAYTGASLHTLVQVRSGYINSVPDTLYVPVVAGTTYHIAVESDLDNGEDHTQGVQLFYSLEEGTGSLSGTFELHHEYSSSEAAGNHPITIVRTSNTAAAETVYFTAYDDTAVAGFDYIGLNIPVTFGAGDTEKTIQIPLLNDVLVEGGESFTVFLSNVNGDTLTATGVYVDDDDDNPANDDFAQAIVLTGGAGLVQGTTLGAGNEPAETIDNAFHSVWYRWTATTTGVVRFFVDGSQSATAYTGTTLGSLNLVAIGHDGVAFGTIAGQTYYIAVSSYLPDHFTLSFVADSTQSVIGFNSSYVDVDETSANASLVVSRVGNLGASATIAFQTSAGDANPGDDYTTASGVLIFNPGQATKTISIPIVNDLNAEGWESFSIMLSSPTGAVLGSSFQADIYIADNDDDPANDDFADATLLTGVSGETLGFSYGADVDNFEIQFGNHVYEEAGVWYRWVAPQTGVATFALPFTDFSAGITIFQGATAAQLRYVDQDNAASTFTAIAGETYHILVHADFGSFEEGEFVLEWNVATAPAVNFASSTATVGENAGTAALTLNLSSAAAFPVTVFYETYDGSADDGEDYTDVDSSVTFAAGETTKTINIPVLADGDFEGDETFSVYLYAVSSSAVIGLTDEVDVTIVDGDTLLPSKTSFTGLVEGDSFTRESSGMLTLNLTAKGTFTGKLTWGGKKFNYKGTFGADGKAEVSIKRKLPLPPLVLRLAIVDGGTRITGTVTDGGVTSEIEGDKLAFNKTSLYDGEGDYSVLLPAVLPAQGEEAVDAPGGHGWAKMKISKLGFAKFAGSLADGTKLTLGVQVSEDGEIPVYLPLYTGLGVITGELSVEEEEDISDAQGTLRWVKPAGLKKQKSYPNGFDVSIDAIASKYVYTKGQRVLLSPTGAGVLVAGEGALNPGIGQPFTLETTNKVTLVSTPAAKVKLTVTAASGLFKGSIIVTGEKKPVNFTGVLFQKQGIGGGYFLRAGSDGLLKSGFVELVPANP